MKHCTGNPRKIVEEKEKYCQQAKKKFWFHCTTLKARFLLRKKSLVGLPLGVA